MFIDTAKVFIVAGSGGNGCLSFRREKHVPLGGPDGGNGGRGGDVFLVAEQRLHTLLDLSFRPHFSAPNGMPGGASNRSGRMGRDLTIAVPVGTVARRDGAIVADLCQPGQTVLIAKGGRGGRGNATFKTSRHTAPRVVERGEPGEVCTLDLELRLMADVGLLGMPNAGKSTLLSRISAAHPLIADYPFTTLSPNLGVARYHEHSFVVADIPGLIEGAHAGRGLGVEFLRHVRRTRVLVHVIDLTGFDGHEPWESYRLIVKEVKSYDLGLAKKPVVIALNKSDAPGAELQVARFLKKVRARPVVVISGVSGSGIPDLLAEIARLCALPVPSENAESEIRTYTYTPDFTVARDGEAFVVSGPKVERMAAMTEFKEEESLRRFQNILRKMGVDRELAAQGARAGTTVRIGELEFEFEPS